MCLFTTVLLQEAEGFTITAVFANLVPVTIGNIIGGGVFIALNY